MERVCITCKHMRTDAFVEPCVGCVSRNTLFTKWEAASPPEERDCTTCLHKHLQTSEDPCRVCDRKEKTKWEAAAVESKEGLSPVVGTSTEFLELSLDNQPFFKMVGDEVTFDVEALRRAAKEADDPHVRCTSKALVWALDHRVKESPDSLVKKLFERYMKSSDHDFWEAAFTLERTYRDLREEQSEIDKCWDAIGTRGNRGHLSLSEQISVLNREFEDLLAQYELTKANVTESISTMQEAVELVRQARTALAGKNAEAERLKSAVYNMQVGGNSLASSLSGLLQLAGKNFPSYKLDNEEARKLLNDALLYEAWLCWATIMRERDKLEELPTADAPAADKGKPAPDWRSVPDGDSAVQYASALRSDNDPGWDFLEGFLNGNEEYQKVAREYKKICEEYDRPVFSLEVKADVSLALEQLEAIKPFVLYAKYMLDYGLPRAIAEDNGTPVWGENCDEPHGRGEPPVYVGDLRKLVKTFGGEAA